jgi:hypothetical protein
MCLYYLGCITLNEGSNAEEINETLSHWPRLKLLELTEQMHDYQGCYYEDQIDFKLCPDLRTVIYQNDRKSYLDDLGLFSNKDLTTAQFRILRFWFDPQGQEISKGNCGVLNYSKKNNEIFSTFLHSL